MALTGPPSISPGLSTLDGRTPAQVTVEFDRLGIQILAALGVTMKPGLDKVLVTLGRFSITAPAGGMVVIPLSKPFPKECSVSFAQCGEVVLKWYPPSRTACVFQRADGAAGLVAGNFLAIGC